MSLPPFLSHMGGLPNRIDSAKINGITRTVDTSPIYGRPQAYNGTIDQEISDSIQSFRDQARQRRIAAAIKRQSQKRK